MSPRKKPAAHRPSPRRAALAFRPASRRELLTLAILALVVTAAVLAAHWTALSARALGIDDTEYLADNPLVQNPSWDSARRFLSEVWDPSSVRGYYQPLTMISLMLDCAMGGSPDNLRVFHRTSLLLHAANALLVMGLLYLLFRNAWAAGAAALLFGVHPMTVETIPWIGERKTLLAAFFALVSLLLYVVHARKGGWRWLALCAGAYVLAVMSKPTATPLPAVFLLMDYWPLRRLDGEFLPHKDPAVGGLAVAGVVRRSRPFRAGWARMVRDRGPLPARWKALLLVLEKVPFFVIAAASSAVTYISQSKLSAEHRSVGDALLIFCHNIVFYPWKMLWPAGLTSHYEYPAPLGLSHPAILAGVLGTAVLVGALAVSLRRTRAPATGWAIFLAAIFPTMGVIGFSNVIASDKFAYLPGVGLLMVLAHYLARLWDWRRGEGISPAGSRGTMAGEDKAPAPRKPRWPPWPRAAILAAVAALAAAEGVGTRRYLAAWQDTLSLYRHMLAFAPDTGMLHNNYGRYVELHGDDLLRQSRDLAEANRPAEAQAALAEANDCLRQARRHFEEAVRVFEAQRPGGGYGDALVNLGKAVVSDAVRDRDLIRQHASTNPAREPEVRQAAWRLEKAILDANGLFHRALLVSGGKDPAAANNLGQIAFAFRGDANAGISWFRQALAVSPYYPDAHLNLGLALEARGRPDELEEAWRHLLKAQAARPADPRMLAAVNGFLQRHPEFRARGK